MLQEKETMPGKNILIADDDQVILDILKKMIQREGYRVFLASNGKDAVEAIKINPIWLFWTSRCPSWMELRPWRR
jgi:CheY-like chemotaxis protein